jgi:hypothetical protein
MGKNTNFTGQPIYNQLISLLNKSEIKQIACKQSAERYVKKFDTYSHLMVMLYATLEGCQSIRETILGFLANAHKLPHIGLFYMVRRSTLSEANSRRKSEVFGAIYQSLYQSHAKSLADSRLSDSRLKQLYILDSTTISLFKAILRGVGRNPLNGKKKGGIKAHTMIKASDNVPCLVRYSEAIKHDHHFLEEALALEAGSIVTFDKGYVDYARYESFSLKGIFYVTRLKDNAIYESEKELDIPDTAHSGILKDEIIQLTYDKKQGLQHRSRRIAYWDAEKERLLIFLTNQFDLEAEMIAQIYKKRWQIELLFKQLKQNFPLKYFLGDNENAIEIQIWVAMIANLLITILKSKVKRNWAFSNLVSIIRQQLMNYIDIYAFLENPEKAWLEFQKMKKEQYVDSLFPLG